MFKNLVRAFAQRRLAPLTLQRNKTYNFMVRKSFGERAKEFQHLLNEWHPTKNPFTPADIRPLSAVKVWWVCSRDSDHVWNATMFSRVLAKAGCPYCFGLFPSKTNNLEVRFPQIAAEFHPTLNKDLVPSKIVAGSHKKVWWQCPNNPEHVYQASPDRRIFSYARCPHCPPKRRDDPPMLTEMPEQLAEFHPEKNPGVDPAQVRMNSRTIKLWWKCSKDPSHEWEQAPGWKIVSRGCPICFGRKSIGGTSFASKCPELAAEWHPYLNGDLKPEQVTWKSSKKIWWQCSKNSTHIWKSSVISRSHRECGCNACFLETVRAARLARKKSIKPKNENETRGRPRKSGSFGDDK
eukprot:Colp12_sorted_trinity150504_noHs@3487